MFLCTNLQFHSFSSSYALPCFRNPPFYKASIFFFPISLFLWHHFTCHAMLFSCDLIMYSYPMCLFWSVYRVRLSHFTGNILYIVSNFPLFLSKIFHSPVVHAINTASYKKTETTQALVASILFRLFNFHLRDSHKLRKTPP